MMIEGESVTFMDKGGAISVVIVRRSWHSGSVAKTTSYSSEHRRHYACSRMHDWALRKLKLIHHIDAVFEGFKNYPGIGKYVPPHMKELGYEELTHEQCEEALKWLNEKCIERRLDLELEHPQRHQAGSA